MMPMWRKSSRSNTQGNECVEVAGLGEIIGIRDSKAPNTARLLLTHQAFTDLIVQAKQGKLNL